jgi:hypothetical protein
MSKDGHSQRVGNIAALLILLSPSNWIAHFYHGLNGPTGHVI